MRNHLRQRPRRRELAVAVVVLALAALVAALALLATAAGAIAATVPDSVIDGSGVSGSCDANGNDPDCVTDDSYWSMDATSDTYAYDAYDVYGTTSRCFDVATQRHGSYSWWNVSYSIVACVNGAKVTSISQKVAYAWSGLQAPLSWVYSLDWGTNGGPEVGGVGTALAYTYVVVRVRFCSWVKCGTTVYPWIWFYIYGDGSTYCYTDRSVVYGCKGSRYGP